ncbi:uncharacterized protein TRAVEDRAFT_28256 [Trametes versicolor FP-101664 SS1]|uniref:uncharacterized protein n=1 Tax=Trametes versicolor (strain FP-101664) TaxID=717944 RepID=UPI0004623D91|nr:uncharacterized protein TRAVEDRAFT_28256 [Trametes versicolor FP-101664 SS1]EIW60771.1 hypothetical protein TRAVEDRAFT_28256 [Trametes versicolor FP-101664 SS1]
MWFSSRPAVLQQKFEEVKATKTSGPDSPHLASASGRHLESRRAKVLVFEGPWLRSRH